LKGAIRRLGKIHREAAGAEVAPELLAKKHLNIRFVVDDENKETHMLGPALRGALDISLIERDVVGMAFDAAPDWV